MTVSWYSCHEYGILGDLLAFLIQSPADFYDTWRTDLRQQENESSTLLERSGRYPDLYTDYSGNLDSNPESDFGLAEFALSECACYRCE